MLNYEFPPFGGGFGQYYLLAEELARKGHAVWYVTSRMRGQKKVEIIDGIRVIRVWTLRRKIDRGTVLDMLSYVISAWLSLKKIIKEFNPQVCHIFFTIPTGLLKFHPYLRKKNTIVTCLGSDVPGHNPDKFNMLSRILTPVVKKIWQKSIVTANSLELAKEVMTISPEQKVQCIFNGIDTDQFRPGNQQNNDKINFIYAGRLISLKRVNESIRLIKRLTADGFENITFTIIGTGTEMENLEKLVKELNIENKVIFKGHISHDEIHKEYQQGEFYIQLSKTEGMSNTIMEAMATGLVPIVTNVGGVQSLIKDGENGLIVAHQLTDQDYQKVVTLLKDKERTMAVRKKARMKIEKEFSLDSLYNSYLKIYQENPLNGRKTERVVAVKICFIAPKAYQLFNPKINGVVGGAEVQLSLIAREFAKDKNLDIHFIVADFDQNDIETHDNIQVWRSFAFNDNIIKRAYRFFRIFRKVNADVYIQRTLTFASGLMALYCKIFRKKFIYMVSHDREADGTHKTYKNPINKLLIKLIWKFADTIIVQNKYQQKILTENGLKNIALIKSGYHIMEDDFSEKESILWVGRSADWKRPELFLELAKEFPNEQFVMICNPATGFEDLFDKISNQAQTIENLTFINHVPFEEIDTYFKKAKVFISTSAQEGFANTFIQAAKNKTPIISMNANPDNFLELYQCGHFCDEKFNLMKDHLKELLYDQTAHQRMSYNAFRYAKKNHNIKINSIKLLKKINLNQSLIPE